jgi:hypothetical protein
VEIGHATASISWLAKPTANLVRHLRQRSVTIDRAESSEQAANEGILDTPCRDGRSMIVLALLTAACACVVLRAVSLRLLRTAQPSDVQAPELWSRLDDVQLTRLLRDAAERT